MHRQTELIIFALLTITAIAAGAETYILTNLHQWHYAAIATAAMLTDFYAGRLIIYQ